MIRKLTLALLLTVCALLVGQFSSAITYVDNGTANTYNLNSGDSLYIGSGTYTGSIGSFPSGAKITVSDMAIFAPTVFPNTNGNSASGTMYVYGTFSFGSALITNSNFALNNYGIVSLGAVTLKGSNQTWTNNYGAVITFSGDVLMNGDLGNNNVLSNYGAINCNANFQMNSGSLLYNYKNMTVSGNLIVNGGVLNNEGKLEAIGSITLNNGASIIRNYCRMISSGGINNTSGNVFNYSYIWAKNNLGLGDIVNKGTITNVSINNSTPMIHGKSLDNRGTITGTAYMYFYGTTSTTGTGITGVTGITTDTIKMYDITRTNGATVYDVQSGTVYPNTVYNAWGIPDSTRAYNIGCSLEMILEVPLAINWNNFDIDLSDNIPILTWSAEFGTGTIFEIQRSYDGTRFSAIKNLQAEVAQSEYKYNDRWVNTDAPVVYYRIKATELSGVEKYTQTRIVKFSNHPGATTHISPNPFTRNFIISFQATEKEMLTIYLYNINGQQQVMRNVSVNSGVNNINITEAAQLPKGIYVVQITNGYKVISSGKIIKQ